MITRIFTAALLSVLTLITLSNQSLAVPTQIVHFDTPQCDPLFIPTDVHEIGHTTEFPIGEELFPTDLGTTPIIPCPITNQTNLPEFVVDIRNMTGKVWSEVWYVADAETVITNFDGEANALGLPPLQEAFRIDNKVSDPGGSHHPLIGESMTADGIWEIGESWQFILQDYTNLLGLPPSAITSIGVGDASSIPATGIIDSSGSIIAVTQVVPEPSSLVLVGLGLAGVFASRRRR